MYHNEVVLFSGDPENASYSIRMSKFQEIRAKVSGGKERSQGFIEK